MASVPTGKLTGCKSDWIPVVREYYRDPAVRARMGEFLGDTPPNGASAVCVRTIPDRLIAPSITSPNEGQRRNALKEVMKAADSAHVLGVKYLVIHPGPERDDIQRTERLQRMDCAADSLNQLAKHCRERQVELVLENMLPHLFTGPVRELMWILGSMAERDVGVCLDTGHAALSGDLHGVVHKLSGHLWMVHASDNNGHRDDHLPPGKGNIDWERLVGHLARIEFAGTLILELSGNRPPSQVLAEAQQARQFLRGIVRRLQ